MPSEKYAWLASPERLSNGRTAIRFAFADVDFRRNQPPVAKYGSCSPGASGDEGPAGHGWPVVAKVHARDVLTGNAPADRLGDGEKTRIATVPFPSFERNGLDFAEPERRFHGSRRMGIYAPRFRARLASSRTKSPSMPTERLLHTTMTHFAASRCSWISSRQWVPPPICVSHQTVKPSASSAATRGRRRARSSALYDTNTSVAPIIAAPRQRGSEVMSCAPNYKIREHVRRASGRNGWKADLIIGRCEAPPESMRTTVFILIRPPERRLSVSVLRRPQLSAMGGKQTFRLNRQGAANSVMAHANDERSWKLYARALDILEG